MIQRAIRLESLRSAVALAAACALLLQALLMGTGHVTRGVLVPAATSAVHHHDDALKHIGHSGHGNDAQVAAQVATLAVQHRDRAEPHGQKDPTKPAKPPHCFWCILAKKLGTGLGPPPIVADVLSPVREAVRTAYTMVAGTTDHRLHSLPPLGARAPPELA